jgi:hypothetical protein
LSAEAPITLLDLNFITFSAGPLSATRDAALYGGGSSLWSWLQEFDAGWERTPYSWRRSTLTQSESSGGPAFSSPGDSALQGVSSFSLSSVVVPGSTPDLHRCLKFDETASTRESETLLPQFSVWN